MRSSEVQADSIRRALACGFGTDEAPRLAFVRWSILEGYAQFNEFITSDDRIVDPRQEFEAVASLRGNGREGSAAYGSAPVIPSTAVHRAGIDGS